MAAEDSVGLQTQSIFDLSGGMVTNYNFTRVAKNQCKLILNSDLIVDGCILRRKGEVKLNTIFLPGHPTTTSLATIGQVTNADLILVTGGGILYEVSTGVPVVVRTGLSVSARFLTTNLNEFLFYVNGVDIPFMTQGTIATTFQVGINQVTNAQFAGFSASDPGAGDATVGNHRLAFRYRSSITGARSNPNFDNPTVGSISSITLAIVTGTYRFTVGAAMVATDAQVDLIDFFAQEAGAVSADAPYYYVGTGPNVVGNNDFNTNVSDNELIVKETLDIDDDLPPVTMRDIQTWRGRLLGIVSDYVIQFSKIRTDENSIVDLPTSFPPDNQVLVGFGDGDPLVKVIIANDYVLAFKRRSVWILLGDFDSPSFGFKRLKTNYTNVGLLNPQAIVQGGERFFFVTDDLKFYWFGITDFSTEQIRLSEPAASDSVSDIFATFASQFRNEVNLVNYNFAQYTQIWISFSNSSTGFDASQNLNTFVFDWSMNGGQGAWHIHTGLNVSCSVLARDNQRNYFVYTGDYYGYVWKQSLTDGDGAEINGTSTGSNFNVINHGPVTNPPFVAGETITGISSGATAVISFVGAGFLRVINATGPFVPTEVIQTNINLAHGAVVGAFVVGDVVTGSISLATGTVNFIDPAFLEVDNVTGVFVVGDVLTGSLSGAITTVTGVSRTSANITTIIGVLNDTTKIFTTDLDGVYVTITEGPGVDQVRRIIGIGSPTQLIVQGGWAVIPTNTSLYTIGGIDWTVWSRDDWLDEQRPPTFDKLGWFLDLDVEFNTDLTVNPLAALEVNFYLNRTFLARPQVLRGIENIGSFWGSGIWGLSIWLGMSKNVGQVAFNLYFKQISHRIRNRYAGYFYRLNGWVYTYQDVEQYRRL